MTAVSTREIAIYIADETSASIATAVMTMSNLNIWLPY
jgi:hypothetical protein